MGRAFKINFKTYCSPSYYRRGTSFFHFLIQMKRIGGGLILFLCFIPALPARPRGYSGAGGKDGVSDFSLLRNLGL